MLDTIPVFRSIHDGTKNQWYRCCLHTRAEKKIQSMSCHYAQTLLFQRECPLATPCCNGGICVCCCSSELSLWWWVNRKVFQCQSLAWEIQKCCDNWSLSDSAHANIFHLIDDNLLLFSDHPRQTSEGHKPIKQPKGPSCNKRWAVLLDMDWSFPVLARGALPMC